METENVVKKLRLVLERFIVLPPGVSLVVALWILNSYLWSCFEFCPYLVITSPVKRCGKTSLLTVLSFLCNRPLFVSAITPAALARSIRYKKPTLLMDEAETVTSEMRTVLNAGFKKGGTVVKCRGTGIEEVDVYGPKALACIGRLPDTVYDRSIIIRMERKQSAQPVEPLRERNIRKESVQLRVLAERWVDSHRKKVVKASKSIEVDVLAAREADIWQPLFAIALAAAPASMSELRKTAQRLSREKAKSDVEDSRPLQLLENTRQIFDTKFRRKKRGKFATEDLLAALSQFSMWKNLDGLELARALRPFGVAPKQLWVGGHNVRGYRRRDFEYAFSAYLQRS